MSMTSCVLYPEIGASQFVKWSNLYGRSTAILLWNGVMNPLFQEKYKDTLVYDGEGFPTLESLQKCKDFTDALGKKRMAKAYEAEFNEFDDTADNIQAAYNAVERFNREHPEFIAYLEHKDGKFKVGVTGKTNDNIEMANQQMRVVMLGQAMMEKLNKVGVSKGSLMAFIAPDIHTDMDHLDDIKDFASAISKVQSLHTKGLFIGSMFEFTPAMTKLFVEQFKDSPIYQRSLATYNGDEEAMLQDVSTFLSTLKNEGGKSVKAYTGTPIVDRLCDNVLDKILQVSNLQPDIVKAETSTIDSKAEEGSPFYNYEQKPIDDALKNFDKYKQNFSDLADKAFKLLTLTQNTKKIDPREKSDKQRLYSEASEIRKTFNTAKSTEDIIRGTISTMKTIVDELTKCKNDMATFSHAEMSEKFKILSNVQFTISAMMKEGQIISEMLEDPSISEIIKLMASSFANDSDDIIDTFTNLRKDMALLIESTQAAAYKSMKDTFIEYIRPFTGDTITVFDKKSNEVRVPIEEIFEHVEENNIWNRWVTTMSDNPTYILKVYEAIVSNAKEQKRLRVIDYCEKIRQLGFEAERNGIKSFDKFFEEDKSSYVMPQSMRDDDGLTMAYDRAKYKKDYDEAVKQIDSEYAGMEITDAIFKEKADRIAKWMSEHTTIRKVKGRRRYIPSPSLYPSASASFNEAENEFYQKWLKIKSEFESMLGEDGQDILDTIKIKQSMIEALTENGITETLSNAGSRLNEIFQKSFDADDVKDASKSNKTVDFNNLEVMHLGVQYQHCPKDKLHLLSTDMIGTLQAYAEMACNYDAMNEIVNPLEIGKSLIMNANTRIKERGGAKEVLKFGRETRENEVLANNPATNVVARLQDFMASQIYQRFMVDSGEVAGVDVNQGTSALLKLGSMCNLGFNALSWSANIATGASMQRIEALSGHFFKYKDLLSADKEFAKMAPDYIEDLTRRGKQSKLYLMDQLFNIRMDASQDARHSSFKKKNLLGKFFGPNIQFIGQDAGDLWMYNRTAIAVLKREKATNEAGEEKSLYDLIKIVPIDPENPSNGNRIVFEEGYTYKGEAVNEKNHSFTKKVGDRIKYINHHLFGVYDEDSQIAARRYVAGRLLMNYRDWLPAQLQYRYGKKTHNMELDEDIEGYYRTGWRFAKQIYAELKNGEFNVLTSYNELDDYDKANIKKCLIEMSTYFTIAALATFFGKSNPEDKTWARKFLRYMALREKTEHAILTPASGLGMFKESFNIIKSPIAASSTLERISSLGEALWIPNWFQEVESGKYEGMSEGMRGLVKSPAGLWYNTIYRNLHPAEAGKAFQ